MSRFNARTTRAEVGTALLGLEITATCNGPTYITAAQRRRSTKVELDDASPYREYAFSITGAAFHARARAGRVGKKSVSLRSASRNPFSRLPDGR